MSITKALTKKTVSKFTMDQNNTGLSEVQIALFTQQISSLTEHMKTNKKDYQARRGLLVFVIKRKRLLMYLKSKNNKQYETVIQELKLKRV